MFQAFLSSFALVALSEMGDKTQLLAFSLSARYKRPWVVLSGIFVATLLNHALAAAVGQQISQQVSQKLLHLILGVTFVAFGFWTLIPDQLEEQKKPSRFGPFLTTVVLFFIAEMGDKTQLATVALGARYTSTTIVTLGTTLGMMVTNGLAVFIGKKITRYVSMKWIRRSAALLFFLFGLLSLALAWKSFSLEY